MAAKKKTPAQIVKTIISAAMGSADISVCQLAKLTGIHQNTVYKDMRDPDGIRTGCRCHGCGCISLRSASRSMKVSVRLRTASHGRL